MLNRFTVAATFLTATLMFSSAVMAQMGQSQSKQATNDQNARWRFNPKDFPAGDGGPAPKRDLTGTWAGPGSSPAVPRGKRPEEPSITPLGEELLSKAKPIGKYSPAGTNDPHARYCDPVGFPQNIYNEGRGLTIATMPDRIVFLLQYMDVWREAYTDGRALPTNVGGTERGSLDPTYNGYSVGHWEDDYTFVVDTTGLDDRTWVTSAGYPHTVNARVQERYTRLDHNDLQLTVTIDDPKIYTKPWNLGTFNYKWIPNQKFDDFSCIPSQVIKYLQDMGDPAGSDPSAAGQRIGGRPE
jgi:hypothetical protein